MADRHESAQVFLGYCEFNGGMAVPANAVKDAQIDPACAMQRTKLEINALVEFPIPWKDFYVHDAPATPLPGTSASDDLGLYNGAYGTATPIVKTYDVKNTTSVTLYMRVDVDVPAEYDPGARFQILINSGLITTLSSGAATVDVEAFKFNESGLVIGSDLVLTAAQSIRSLTLAEKTFTLDPASLNPGDKLDVRIAITIADVATGTAVIGGIACVKKACDIRG